MNADVCFLSGQNAAGKVNSHPHPLCFANQRISQNIPRLSSQSKMNNHCFGIPMLLISLDFVHTCITSLINKRAITGITTSVM